MDKSLKQVYNQMTKEQVRQEVILLKKELKPLLRQIGLIEQCLEYLNSKHLRR